MLKKSKRSNKGYIPKVRKMLDNGIRAKKLQVAESEHETSTDRSTHIWERHWHCVQNTGYSNGQRSLRIAPKVG